MSDSCQTARSAGLTPAPRVLFVEDNQALSANVFAYLDDTGFVLDAAPDGPSGLELAQTGHYDVVVLDWMLPRLEGVEVLRRLRARDVDVPVLMLTARDQLESKLAGFEAGADDYLSKPFALAELAARIRALVMRRMGRKRLLRVGDLRFDVDTQAVHRGNRAVTLFSGGRALLELLMRESPHIVTKERLEHVIWGDQRPERELLQTHIYELRRRLELDGESKLLHTVTRVGYRLVSPEIQ